MLAAYGLLALAILVEVVATACLPRTAGFRDPVWSGVVLAGYGLSIWLLGRVVEHIPVSVAYAVWSGVGTATIAVVGVVWLGESWTWVSVVALAMVVVGVVLLNLSGAH